MLKISSGSLKFFKILFQLGFQRVFDYDNSGALDFAEYILALNATNLNSREDKLNWMFDVFDKDGGGTISMEEIQDLVRGLIEMAGHEVSAEDIEEASREIMTTIDEDGDGDVTKVSKELQWF